MHVHLFNIVKVVYALVACDSNPMTLPNDIMSSAGLVQFRFGLPSNFSIDACFETCALHMLTFRCRLGFTKSEGVTVMLYY